MSQTTIQNIVARRDAFIAGRDIYIQLQADGTDLHPFEEDLRARPVFVQYLNPEILACYSRDLLQENNHQLLGNALYATRLAILATDSYLVVPSSYIFEVPNFALFLRMVAPLAAQGLFCYTGPFSDLDNYKESKIIEYRHDTANPYLLSDLSPKDWRSLGWKPRHSTSTAIDIGHRWRTALDPHGDLYVVRQQLHKRWTGRRTAFEKAISGTPERLEGQAFISRFVTRTIPLKFTPFEQTRLNFFLSRAYLESYALDLDAMLLVDFAQDDLTCGLSVTEPSFARRLVSARVLDIILKYVGISQYVHTIAKWDALLALRSEPEFALLAVHAIKSLSLNPVRVAAVRARRTHDLVPAESFTSAVDNIRYVTDSLIWPSEDA